MSGVWRWRLIERSEPRRHERFNRIVFNSVYDVSHSTHNVSDLIQATQEIDNSINQLLNEVLEDKRDDDMFSLYIENDVLQGDKRIYTPYRKIGSRDPKEILDKIESVAQSNDEILMSGRLRIKVTVLEVPRGGGKRSAPKNIHELSRSKNSVVEISNRDNSCFFRALAVCKFIQDYSKEDKRWTRVRRVSIGNESSAIQTCLAKQLALRCSRSLNDPISLADLDQIQKEFKNEFKLIIVDAQFKDNYLFRGNSCSSKTIYLEFIRHPNNEIGHFNAITNIRGYMGKREFCYGCKLPFNKYHECSNTCKHCNEYPPCKFEDLIHCPECNGNYVSETCYSNHLKKICVKIRKCERCHRKLEPDHECDKYTCRRCGESFIEQPHYCWFRTLNEPKITSEDNKRKFIVAYDIESTQTCVDDTKKMIHAPNLLIMMGACDNCYPEKGCDVCDKKLIFEGYNCVSDFLTYIIKDLAVKAERLKCMVYVYAHNARGYDSQFILTDLCNKGYPKFDVIATGSKILRIVIGNIKFQDTLSFFMCPLSHLPKAFNLNEEQKGCFPHLFNTFQNWDYHGTKPAINHFGIEYMTPSQSKALKEWYDTVPEDNWNFRDNLITYCESDVRILIKSLFEFRRAFRDISGHDPTTRCFTLASVALESFRFNFLQDKQLAISPRSYFNERKASAISDAYLESVEDKFGIKLIKEYRISNYFVDGYHPPTRTIYEFLGCYYHGHSCTNGDINNPQYRSTIDRINHLMSLNYKVVVMWECDFRLVADTSRIDHFTTIRNVIKPIVIRNSFFGGRTNCLQFHGHAADNEEICYYDVCSLYPYVMKNRIYPVGHPVLSNKFTQKDENDLRDGTLFGFVSLTILPPTNLYLPVLPSKVNGKLVFSLCHACASECRQELCDHPPHDRALTGTWTTPELKLALEKGYRIIKVYQYLSYSKPEYSLFAPYVNMWLKVKTEASGYPSSVSSDQDKTTYIEQYHSREGVSLNPENIALNPAKRMIAKLMLNSLYGKFGQRANLTSTSFVTSYDEFLKLALDDTIAITGETEISENMLKVTWKRSSEELTKANNTNIAVASFVTAYARLVLYDIMAKIEEIRPYSLLYHDTDSVIFLRNKSDPRIQLGSFLGDLTNEIPSGSSIRRFVSLGPKTYGYETEDGQGNKDVVMKIKGLKLSTIALDTVDFGKMLDMALRFKDNHVDEIKVPQMSISTDSKHQIYTHYFHKRFRATSDKRCIRKDLTVPFGYIE